MTAITHHTHFYLEDGSIILQVSVSLINFSRLIYMPSQIENILYKLHMSVLQTFSTVFKDMFAMPRSEECLENQEGMSDEKPVRLGQPFTVKKMDYLLFWLLR
jgi:hypothetical protein